MRYLSLVVILTAVIGVAAGCGGGGPESVPGDSIAVVGNQEITKAQFDALLDQARRSYTAQKRPFPKTGTPEYEQLKRQAVQFLVQRAQFAEKAEDLDVAVTDKQVDARLEQIKKQYFGGNEKKYQQQLKTQGLSEEQVRNDIKSQLISEGIFKEVTDDVKVTDKEIGDYYKKNRSQYETPESREVRHILIKRKALANRIYGQLRNGGNFAQLAKRYSEDPGSKTQGGKLTISRGQTVPQFDRIAFQLKVNQLSAPVKTQYGFHIIQALGPIKPKKSTPLKQVKEAIRQQLVQTKKNEAMTNWVEDTKKDFEDDTEYQVGYAPPATDTAATTDR
jgi:foldase protein PrsA